MKLTLKEAVDNLNRPILINYQVSVINMLAKAINYNPVTQKYQVIREDIRTGKRKIIYTSDLVKAIDKYNSIIIKETPHETEQETPATMHRGEVQPESNPEKSNGRYPGYRRSITEA